MQTIQTNKTEFPFSQAQQVAWFMYNLAPDDITDKIAFAIRIKQQLNYECLNQAFEIIIQRHPSLRSTYREKQGQLVQQELEKVNPEIEFIDTSRCGEEELQQRISSCMKHRFDLAAGNVVRMSLFSSTASDHILLLTVHYIACDRQSLLILINELLTTYHALQNHTPINLPKLTTSYLDYVQQELNLLNSQEAKQRRNYHQQKLAGELPILELPGSQARLLRTYHGGCCQFNIDPDLTKKLKFLATTANFDLSTLLLATFQVLLHRYTAIEDILVGCSNFISQPEFNYVVGNLSNTSIVRVSVNDGLSFLEFINQVKAALVDDQYLPFPLLVKQLQLNSQLSHPPICQVGFSYHQLAHLEMLSELLDGKNIGLNYFEIPEQRTEFDLNWEILETAESLTCLLHYNSDLLDAEITSQTVAHLQNLLTVITAFPDSLITQLPLLSDSEQHQLLIEWNATQRDYDLSQPLHELFVAQVNRTPNAIAVIFEQQQLTYRELNTQANQLAHHLQTLGIKPETLMGVCVERSLEMVVCLLGVLKAGGAYVPIDPEYPQERIAYMLDDSQVKILLTQEKLLAQLPKHQGHTICIDADWQEISTQPNTNPDSSVQPENLAYVIYTSGSTGKPKGAMNTHKGICNRLLWMQEAYQINSTDSVLQKTPFSFDVSVWEFFWTLLNGARLVIAEPGGHRDSTYLINLISQEQITTLHFVPSMLQVFLESRGVEKCTSLKRVICSGEALPLDLQKRFFQRLKCELHNLYGPTEAAIDVTFWQCQPETNLKIVPIGRPIANTQIYILDAHLQPVVVRVTGEIYIGGVGVARGYLNREELTHQKFIPHPFSDLKTYLYKTGDLGRYLPDGNIEYVGRTDYQVKIRGYRIEIGEIENVLSTHPQVREAVVIACSEQLTEKQLIAYITYTSEKPTINSLRDFLKKKLPDFMVPAAFVILETMPLTPSGKVNRKALPKPSVSCFSESNGFIAPRNQVEQQLVKIWSKILHLSQISVKDNFFAVGGDSLKALHLISKIEQEFHKEIPLATLLTNPVIEDLAKVIQNSNNQIHYSPLVPIQAKGHKQPFFCVHPAGGHVLCYFKLAHYMGNDQPFYGLQAQGFYGNEEPLTRVEDMASLYVKTIREFQPQGPYRVGGWSFGGVVAYEVAQQLYRQGQEVSLLAILDSYVPIVLDQAKKIDNIYLVGVLSRVFGGMFGKDNLVAPEEIQHLNIEEKLNYIIDKARKARIFPPGVERQNNRRILDVLVGTLKATYSYVRQPYPGNVTIFRAREKHIMAPDPTLVWVELFSVLAAGEINIVDVPGNHYSFVLEPHVQVLAKSLKACLSC
jgi:amino acid adenylation domain-containing protein